MKFTITCKYLFVLATAEDIEGSLDVSPPIHRMRTTLAQMAQGVSRDHLQVLCNIHNFLQTIFSAMELLCMCADMQIISSHFLTFPHRFSYVVCVYFPQFSNWFSGKFSYITFKCEPLFLRLLSQQESEILLKSPRISSSFLINCTVFTLFVLFCIQKTLKHLQWH